MSEQETMAMVPAIISETHEESGCSLAITVDLSSLGVPDRWQYDSVIDVDPNGGEIVLLFYPPEVEP